MSCRPLLKIELYRGIAKRLVHHQVNAFSVTTNGSHLPTKANEPKISHNFNKSQTLNQSAVLLKQS